MNTTSTGIKIIKRYLILTLKYSDEIYYRHILNFKPQTLISRFPVRSLLCSQISTSRL